MVYVRTVSLIKGKRDKGVTRSERQTHLVTLSSQGGRKGKGESLDFTYQDSRGMHCG